MPRIAQHGVDDTTLEFTELKFLDPTPDSLSLSQTGIVHNPITYTPTLDPFNASLYLVTNNTFAQDRIMQITIPQIHAMHPTSQSTVVSQTVHIENMDQLTDYSTQVLKNEWIETALTGKTKLHLGKLPVVTVDFNSTSKYKGNVPLLYTFFLNFCCYLSSSHLLLFSTNNNPRTQRSPGLQRNRRKDQPRRQSRPT
jgi:hypothetical protein